MQLWSASLKQFEQNAYFFFLFNLICMYSSTFCCSCAAAWKMVLSLEYRCWILSLKPSWVEFRHSPMWHRINSVLSLHSVFNSIKIWKVWIISLLCQVNFKLSKLFLIYVNVKRGEEILACTIKKEKSYFAKSSKLCSSFFFFFFWCSQAVPGEGAYSGPNFHFQDNSNTVFWDIIWALTLPEHLFFFKINAIPGCANPCFGVLTSSQQREH